MPHPIAERLRQIAIECARLAASCTDKHTADELEGVSAELAEKARNLDDLFNLTVERAS